MDSHSDNLFTTNELLETPHGFFDRIGGVSTGNFSSLNSSFHVGDDPDNVIFNRKILKEQLTIPTLVSAKQIHGNTVKKVNFTYTDTELEDCDSIITNEPGIGLLIQQADCQAILIHDPVTKTIAAIHCGWRGNVQKIIEKTISQLTKEYKTNPTDIRCVISASLGPCCAEFIHFKELLPETFHPYQAKRLYFDFWEISRMQLKKCGVIDSNIETVKKCTVCYSNYFSHRRSKLNNKIGTGRNCSVIALER